MKNSALLENTSAPVTPPRLGMTAPVAVAVEEAFKA